MRHRTFLLELEVFGSDRELNFLLHTFHNTMTEPTAKSKAEAATVVSASRLVPSTLSSDYAATLSNCLPPTPPPPKCRGLTLGSDTSLPSPSSHPPPSPKVSIRKLSAMKLSNLASMGIHSTFDTQAIYKRVKEVLAEEQRLNDLEGEGELMKLSRMGKRMRSMSVEIVNTREVRARGNRG